MQEYFAFIQSLMAEAHWVDATTAKRSRWTRAVDTGLATIRKHAPPIHWVGARLFAAVLFLYARFVAFTSNLVTIGEPAWPDLPSPSVIALWHRDAPSLIVAFAKQRPRAKCFIMIAGDPRGDSLAFLCRLLGFQVVRGSSEAGGWEAIAFLRKALAEGACVFLTADGGGPARVVKVGAVALASAASVPLLPMAADPYPAIVESHKWDVARNPLPFGSILVFLGPPRLLKRFSDLDSIREATKWLKDALEQAGKAVAGKEHG
jgi:lysophospholipid acyltransferase (LPLAT)-like uncharacterized protein